jgi:hypothetical protein
MPQRVNIQYSIDVEDLPTEVERLLQTAYGNLASLEELCVHDPPALSLGTVERIDHIRQRLADIDYLLNDVSTIVNGYIAYKAQEGLPPHSEPETLTTEAAQEEALKEQIVQFKQQMTQIEDAANEVPTQRS